jgi:hypothetical protein
VALIFGLVFLGLNVVGALAQRTFGSASFYFVSAAGGLLSSASSIASAATLIHKHEGPAIFRDPRLYPRPERAAKAHWSLTPRTVAESSQTAGPCGRHQRVWPLREGPLPFRKFGESASCCLRMTTRISGTAASSAANETPARAACERS